MEVLGSMWGLSIGCSSSLPNVVISQDGFGKLNPEVEVKHTSPLPYWILHKAWDFMEPQDRECLMQADAAFEGYACLQWSTATVSIACLHDKRPPPESFTSLQHDRAWWLAVTLIRFDFDYGE